ISLLVSWMSTILDLVATQSFFQVGSLKIHFTACPWTSLAGHLALRGYLSEVILPMSRPEGLPVSGYPPNLHAFIRVGTSLSCGTERLSPSLTIVD
ncbi:hypothetical protein M9458_008784, partial [Cirrhinus mrigala]